MKQSNVESDFDQDAKKMSLQDILADKSFSTSKSQILRIENGTTTEDRQIQV
jgi:hypothetical protein